MTISRREFALAAAAAAISVRRLDAAGVDGKWEGEVPNFRGPVAMTFEFKSDGETLTGTLGNDMMGMIEVTEGKISGDEVSFVQLMQRGDLEVRIQYEGKVTGDEMELTRTMQRPPGARCPGGRPGGGPGAPVTFTLKRVQ